MMLFTYLLDAYSCMLHLLPVLVYVRTWCYATVTLVLIRHFFFLSVVLQHNCRFAYSALVLHKIRCC